MSAVDNQLNGLLVVDKPGKELAGLPSTSASTPANISTSTSEPERRLFTSHDVVAVVRRWSHQRRIGHTGTLDPLASGVLVLCLGTATRLVEYYQGETKRYYAEVVLGHATDTYDSLGQVVATAPALDLDVARVEQVLEKLRGTTTQRPPAFSAIKQGGEALYAKARRGEAVEVEERPVTFYRLELLALTPPDRLALRVVCSAGAYVRSLAHDLGLALGTYGTLDVLRREAVGEFRVETAATLAQVQQAAQAGGLGELLLPPGTGLPLPPVQVDDDELLRRFSFGQRVVLDLGPCNLDQPLRQVRDAAGTLAGIIRCVGMAAAPPTEPPAAGGQIAEQTAGHTARSVWKAEKWLS